RRLGAELNTSPACGGGRRAERGGWGKSIHSTSAFCGNTPTLALPPSGRRELTSPAWGGEQAGERRYAAGDGEGDEPLTMSRGIPPHCEHGMDQYRTPPRPPIT